MRYKAFSAIGMLVVGTVFTSLGQKTPTLPYQNKSLPIPERVEDLLGRMTLEEKIGQMTQIATTEINAVDKPKNKNEKFKPYLDKAKAEKLIKEYHIGSFLAAFAVTPEEWYQFSEGLQRVNMATSRLGIPMIYGNDHVHGANYILGATLFPQPVNLASTFNKKYAAAMGTVTASEISDLGQPWNFAPILDIGRNPYWPRQYETFGEDPYWVGELGVAYIKALESASEAKPYKIAATAKHFLGYSDPKSGWDRAPTVLPEQEMREIFLPPFKKAVDAGVKTFMVNSGEVNGQPVHASKKLLQDLLRKELGFKGVILTDWADILQLIGQHKVAHNEKEATLMALKAGIDMSMTASSTGFCKVTKELVQEGYLPQSTIDNAVRRILTLKYELGLFENPYPRKDRLARIGNATNKQEALEATRESMVLLKNDGLLPLGQQYTKRILVVGPSTNSKRNLAGGWTINWMGGDEDQFPANMPTVWTGLKAQFPQAKIDTSATTINGQLDAAKLNAADLVVLALGEEPYAEGLGNINDLNLPADQQNLIQQVQKSGKPNVLVLISGRPRLVTNYLKKTSAFLYAGLPGERGGQVIAEILAGTTNPSGKMSVTYPAEPGHITPYNARVHDKYTHAFPFGFGLSYTNFTYSNLTLKDSVIGKNSVLTATVTITNTGKVEGQEAVLTYVKDEVRSLSTPLLKSLRRVEKVKLKPGESKIVNINLTPEEDLSYPDEHGNQHLEEGYFELEIGPLKKRFLLKGPGQNGKQADFGLKNYLQEEIGTN